MNNWIVINDWNAINNGMLVEKSNKYCIVIIKGTNNLRWFFKKKMTTIVRQRDIRYTNYVSNIMVCWWKKVINIVLLL